MCHGSVHVTKCQLVVLGGKYLEEWVMLLMMKVAMLLMLVSWWSNYPLVCVVIVILFISQVVE